jgi:hypothetical protein
LVGGVFWFGDLFGWGGGVPGGGFFEGETGAPPPPPIYCILRAGYIQHIVYAMIIYTISAFRRQITETVRSIQNFLAWVYYIDILPVLNIYNIFHTFHYQKRRFFYGQCVDV